jgi:alanine dehydrogenase
MIIGIPKEIKQHEYRVGVSPAGVEDLVKHGHRVLVECNAGTGSGFDDCDYQAVGAEIYADVNKIWDLSELIVKVKEPQTCEILKIKPKQIIFTYFHFAANINLSRDFLKTKAIAVAYETVQLSNGSLPLLTPMSEIAGRMSIHEGAKYLEEPFRGRGILLAGVPGVAPAKVVILGGGVVGFNAAKMASGLGADVTLLDVSLDRLRYLDDVMPPNVITLMSNSHNIREQVKQADLLIGAVLIPGAKSPVLVSHDLVKQMKRGAVIVDVGVDQGGCIATTKPTTHDNPIYVVDGVVHYGVTNMPGVVARTSSTALTNATFPYVLQIANNGFKSIQQNSPLGRGLNMAEGEVYHDAVAKFMKDNEL